MSSTWSRSVWTSWWTRTRWIPAAANSETCEEFTDAGFLIERLVEPLPQPEMADRSPEDHAKLRREPGFIAFRLLRPG